MYRIWLLLSLALFLAVLHWGPPASDPEPAARPGAAAAAEG
ncbi:hypothetical protein QF032_001355 [Streptomyces achromogenes]|nr:hypothetical protein [Streptomyces achromogenes]MDQ0829511.1 hypothetical protein [Streptomyces achromogenes]